MELGALEPYEGALRQAQQLSLVTADGRLLPLAIDRYLDDADDADRTVLDRCTAPVLDVGCGPGRIVYALAAEGMPALGVDIAEFAVALTVQRGAPALSRDVFDRVPGEGRWPTVLVLDGNIGIGGDVAGLLTRLALLAAPRGSLIVEASTTEAGTDDVLQVRFTDSALGTGTGPEFGWSVVAADVLMAHAERAGLKTTDYWSAGGREFLRFERSTDAA
ncbi:class I SAM-dependent methyltransferase [soil metagenome]|jgi:SAM-dependent methyltransferase